MKNALLVFALCLLAAPAYSTFELQDPANIIQQDQGDTREDIPPHGDSSEPLDQWANKNVGTTACADYLLYQQEGSQWYWSRLYWLQGFISGVSHHELLSTGESRLDFSGDADALAQWIKNYCEEFPSSSLVQAAKAFYDEFSE